MVLLVLLLVFAALPLSARAEGAEANHIDAKAPQLPFTRSELKDALAQRGGDTDVVRVRAVSDTLVEVWTVVGRLQVDVGAARGAQAARLVALQLAELGSEPQIAAACCSLVRPLPIPASNEIWIGIAAGTGREPGGRDTTFNTLRVEGVRGRGRWRLGGSLGWATGKMKAYESLDPLSLDLGIARGVVGIALSRLTFLVSPQLVLYSIGPAPAGLTWAFGTGVHVQITGTTLWKLTASAEADAFGYHIQARTFPGGEKLVANAGISLTAMLGLAWRHR